MPGATTRYALAYPVAADAVSAEPTTVKALADKLDLLLGEAGSFTNSGAITANVTYSQTITLARSYAAVFSGGFVTLELTGVLSLPNVWNWWITAISATQFTVNVQVSAASAIGARGFAWRYWPAS